MALCLKATLLYFQCVVLVSGLMWQSLKVVIPLLFSHHGSSSRSLETTLLARILNLNTDGHIEQRCDRVTSSGGSSKYNLS